MLSAANNVVSLKKVCSKCGHEKELSLFSADRRKKNGLASTCKECRKAIVKNSRLAMPKQKRLFHKLWWKYRMRPQQYLNMLAKQNSSCAICIIPFSDKLLPAVDHCHKTNKVRGLLCINCNTALGHFRDNPVTLRQAAFYVERVET